MTDRPRRLASKTSLVAALIVMGAVGWSGTAAAQSDFTVFAGGKLDVADSAYVGATVGVPGSADNKGWAVRGVVYTGGYDYKNGPTTIDADFTGGQAELIYRFGTGPTWGSVGLGYRYVDTDLSPGDPGNRRDGGQGEMMVSLDGGHVAGPWRVDWYGSYGFRLDDYDALASVTHTIGASGRLRAGLEIAADGDSNYSAYHVGPVLGVKVGDQSEFQISAGLSDGDDRGSSGYVRVAFYRSV